MKKLDYKKAGVDIDRANLFVENIKPLISKINRLHSVSEIGGFGGLFNLNTSEFKEPILVSSTDGVGTKLKIASLVNIHNTVGIDAVAMNVNDILCTGARPLFFLDYIGCGRLNPAVLTQVVEGIVNGCRDAGCALIGGETAEMPGMYKENEYDIAGFSVGVVEKKDIIDTNRIQVGDIVIGLESSGLHSNGFSLVRKVFANAEMKRMAEELLKPTRIYVKPVLSLLRTTHDARRTTIKGIAHITGGAFYDKISRIIPKGLAVRIQKDSWSVPQIFKLIQRKGNIENNVMYRTFNMGIGMVLVTAPDDYDLVSNELKKFDLCCWIIGRVIKGNREVVVS